MNCIEPKLQRGARLGEGRSYSRVKVMAAKLARISAFCLDAIPAGRALTRGASKALAKAHIEQVLQASFVVMKLAEKLGGGKLFRHD